MTSKFELCHEITARWEGGWSDHKDDPGGKTNWGVTQATLSAYLGRPATVDEIRQLPRARAESIYRKMFWDAVGGDALPDGVDLVVYDYGVNSGPKVGVKALQAVLGVLPDGWVGDTTIKALAAADKADVINGVCDRRLAFMKRIRNKKTRELLWASFGRGWQRRVDDIRERALRMADAPIPPAMQKRSRPLEVPAGGTAKALPAPPVERAISTEQKVGGAAAGAAIVTTTLGPVAGFWRDNKDILTDPMFIAVALILSAVITYLLFIRPKKVEESE
jgi:lysozyme family protein